MRLQRARDMRLVVHAGDRRDLRERRHVKRLPHVMEHLDYVRPRDRVSDSHSRKSENFRKRPKRDYQPLVVVVVERVGIFRIAYELEVRLVGDDHHVLGHSREKSLPLRSAINRTGRIIRIAEKNDSRVRVDQRRHRVEIVRISV